MSEGGGTFASMVAVAWTAIGLLAATLGAMVAAVLQLNFRIDAFGRDLRAAIDAQGARIDEQGRSLRAAIDEQGARIDEQGVSLRSAIDAQTARIDALSARIDVHLERHTG